MRWVFVLFAALVWLSGLAAGTAEAQSIPAPPSTKPSPAEEAGAKRNFESGLRLYGEGAYAEALIAFEQSYRGGGRPSALKNVAQCHRNLKHFVDAYEAYEQMLTLHEAQLSAADKTAVRQALDELGVLTGTLEITVDESGADVEVDGKSVGRSPLPKPKRLKVDPHTVRVTKAGFAPFEQSVTIGSQEQKKLAVKLEPEKNVGRVSVHEQGGRDVHVFVDGNDKGPAPWEGDVDAGEHTIVVRGDRFASEPRRTRVTAKEHLDVALDATPLSGHLRVTTVPATATIRIDGEKMGAGAWEGDLAEGRHRIEVAVGSEPPQVREVVLARGQIVAQEIPVVSAIAGGGFTDYAGIYVRLAVLAGFGVAGNADNQAPETPTYASSGRGSFMGDLGADLRVGKAWDWYAGELVGIFFFEHRDKAYELQPNGTGTSPIDYRDESNAANAFLGVGGRVTSKDDGVRFTFGAAPGIMIRSFSPQRHQDGNNNGGATPTQGNNGGNRFVPTPVTTTNNNNTCSGCFAESDFAGAGYTTLGLVLDAGVLIGRTPGTKFFFGANAILDFAPTLVVGPDTNTPLPDTAYASPGRGVLITHGANVYLGPTLGVQFGH